MNTLVSFLSLFLLSQLANAQYPSYEWAKSIHGTGATLIKSSTLDLSGNLYIFGVFNGTTDFDPGIGISKLTSSGLLGFFISKYDADGKFIWSKQLSGSNGFAFIANNESIKIDLNGNVYATGTFFHEIDFDPGPKTHIFDAGPTGDVSTFFLKLDSFGNFIWAKQIQGANCKAITCDKFGNVFSHGHFSSIVDFDPGPGTYKIKPEGSNIHNYLLKLDSNGYFLWARSFEAGISTASIGVDENSNIYTLGAFGSYFSDTLDFDPGPGRFNLIYSSVMPTVDMYVLKLNSNGNFIWAKNFGGKKYNFVGSLNITESAHIYMSGLFHDKVDFDPGPGIFNLNAPGDTDVFITKMDTSGKFVWAKSLHSLDKVNVSISNIDKSENVYINGTYTGTTDFDPGAGTSYLYDDGSYILKLDPTGNLVWVRKVVPVSSMSISSLNQIYSTGGFKDTVQFDHITLTSQKLNNDGDGFISKISQDSCSNLALIIDSLKHITCKDSVAYASAHTLHGWSPYKYVWEMVPPLYDSVATFIAPGLYSLKVTDANGCMRTSSVIINSPPYTNGFDLSANLVSEPFRPGRKRVLTSLELNNGCTPVNGVISIVLDSLVSYDSASPSPDAISGDTLIWNISNLAYDSAKVKQLVYLTTDVTARTSDTICFDVLITPVKGDADSTNNKKRYCYPVRNSFDPNIKSVNPSGACQEQYVLKREPLTYTVQFQNNGNAGAIDIYILDKLDSNLDINSLRVVGQSHSPMITEILPGNVMKFRFDNINLPDSGTNEARSHGYVIFEVTPKNGLVNGTIVKGKAGIYFDFNVPVMTNEVRNTLIDIIPACSVIGMENTELKKSIRIYPNPNSGLFTVVLSKPTRNSRIEIYNNLGALVYKATTENEVNTIDLSKEANGLYFVKVVSGNSVIATQKIIKQ